VQVAVQLFLPPDRYSLNRLKVQLFVKSVIPSLFSEELQVWLFQKELAGEETCQVLAIDNYRQGVVDQSVRTTIAH
jgi:hypothetical protein